MTYYNNQLARLNNDREFAPTVVITDSEGNKTNAMNINEESAKELISYLSSFLPAKIEFDRITNDINGNPRYVCHYSDLLSKQDNESLPTNVTPIFKVNDALEARYKLALKKAKQLGGKKYDTKSFGGCIVFQSYNIVDLEKSIINLTK